jgi:tRNA modification GTPase
MADADIVLLVLDNSEPLSDDDRQLLEEVPAGRRLIALNKSDLAHRLEEGAKARLAESQGAAGAQQEVVNGSGVAADASFFLHDAVSISALTGEGLDELREKIFQYLSGDSAAERDDLLVTDARQQQAIRTALNELEQARTLIIEGELEEIILLKLHAALTSLGDITGETLTDDILGQIFSTFCIGK